MQVDLWDTQILHWYLQQPILWWYTTSELLDSNTQSNNCALFVWAGTAGSFS